MDEFDDMSLMWQSSPRRRDPLPALIGASAPAWPWPETPESKSMSIENEITPDVAAPEVSLERLEAQICSLAGQLASSTCAWLVLIAEFSRRNGWVQWGMKSCAHWLSWACSVAPGAAREYVRVASALESLPLIQSAFAAGRLSYSKVRAVTRVADRVDEQVLLEQALVHTAAQLEHTVRGFRKSQGSGLEQQHRRKARWFYDEDGMLVLTARLPAEQGAVLVAALRQAQHDQLVNPAEISTAETSAAETSATETDPAGDERRSAADALVLVAERALAAGPVDRSGDDRHLVVLHVDAGILSDSADSGTGCGVGPESLGKCCRIEDGPGLDPVTALRVACDATILPVVSSAMPWEQLNLGRSTRAISKPQRRALRLRDGGCRFPGCSRRQYLEAHHVRHWAHGGSTDLDNLILLCRTHHMSVHEGGFTIARAAQDPSARDVQWVFRRPDTIPFPAVRDMFADDSAIDGTGNQDSFDPTAIRAGWRGESFSLADSVGVLVRSMDSADALVPS